MAAERTLMAWVRTAISLISFGFTIFKFMQTMASAEKLQKFGLGDVRTLGMTMIGIGMVALVIAIIQHIGHMKRLGIHDRKHLYSLSVVFAGAFWLVGALAFVLVATD
jgi:putative membrane protein